MASPPPPLIDAQTLDQIFVTPALLLRLAEIRASHINSDWPADEAGDGLRGTSDHDPQVAKFKLIPTIQDLLALLEHFDADGAFSGSNLAPGLADFLERAERLADEGRLRSTDPPVRVFFLQLNTLGTRAIRADAAAALAREAGILFDSIFVSLRF